MRNDVQQASAYHMKGQFDKAVELYLAILRENPDLHDVRYSLGMLYGEQGKYREALPEITRVLTARPDFGEGWSTLSDIGNQLCQYELALFAAEQATHLMPDHARAWSRRGIALSRLEREEEAIEFFRRAVCLDKMAATTWINLCYTAKRIGKLGEAEDAIRQAYRALGRPITDQTTYDYDDDSYDILDWHLSLLELVRGNYAQGFARFRARFRGGTNWRRLDSRQPCWRGEDLCNRTILVTLEGGHGDVLMMARYVPLLKEMGARVLFQVHPALKPFLKGWGAASEVFGLDEPYPSEFDFHAPIFDLPYRFKTALDTIPNTLPYLPLPAMREDNLLARDGRPCVGVVWSGSTLHQNDRHRSLPLAIIAELFRDESFQFFAINHDMNSSDAKLLASLPITDLSPKLRDFADTAQFVQQMDLIISCDSAVAHLAGGLGKKIWTLLPLAPDWRWLVDRNDTPWYPNMRLFRQTSRGDWKQVIHQVQEALEGLRLS